MIIWRGFGIVVFVIFCISAWIMSYSYSDTRLGNGLFMGWSMLVAAGPTLLLYLALRSYHLKEKELAPGEVAEPQEAKSKIFTGHSFFFIPVVFWPLIFLGFGLYLVNSSDGESDSESVIADEDEANDYLPEGELTINFWNSLEDTTEVVAYYEDGTERMREIIPPNYIRYATYDAGFYTFETEVYDSEVMVNGGEPIGENSYKQGWYILDPDVDLILVEVTEMCKDMMEDEVRAIDWSKRITERFEGGQLMVPELLSGDSGFKYTVIDPGWEIPTSKEENEKVYALVPIYYDEEASDAYLDDWLVKL